MPAQTLGSDWRAHIKKAGKSDTRFPPLGQIKWHRVVLDVRALLLAAVPTLPALACMMKPVACCYLCAIHCHAMGWTDDGLWIREEVVSYLSLHCRRRATR